MVVFKTEFSGYSVKFSPWRENLIAVATAQNFGIVGNGKQYVLELTPNGVEPIAQFYSQDGLFDCVWSEENEFHVVGVSGDGSIKLWDIRNKTGNPLRAWKEHTQEIYSIDWNLLKKDSFITGSWDYSIKLWSPVRPQSIRTFQEHTYCVYATVWDPRSPDRFASASGDKSVKIWDVREANSTLHLNAHPAEVLAVDWNKYEDNIIFTGSVDKSIRMWDLRNPVQPLTQLHGHNYAVRRIKCSPHFGNILSSVSYDRNYCLWDLSRKEEPLVERLELHTEFALGCDFNIFIEGQVATCGWDSTVNIWQLGKDPRT